MTLTTPPAIPPSPWSLDYTPEIGTPSVCVKYNGNPVGRVQSASLVFDATTGHPQLKLEIHVPGIVINHPTVEKINSTAKLVSSEA